MPIYTLPDVEKEPTSKFNKYTAKVFGQSDLEDLVRICSDLSRRGVPWVMSNRDTEGVRALFPSADIVGFTARRSLAAKSRSEEHTSELQSLMRISYAVFVLKQKTITTS